MKQLAYLFKSTLIKLYFRVVKTIFKKMQLRPTHERLIKISTDLLNRFKENFFNDRENELSLVSELMKFEGGDWFEFKFLGRNFILEREVMSYGGFILYRTHEVKVDLNNYPNTRMVLIPELDIIQHIEHIIRFHSKKTINTFYGEQDATFITDFNLQYISQLAKFIQAREFAYLKSLEKIE